MLRRRNVIEQVVTEAMPSAVGPSPCKPRSRSTPVDMLSQLYDSPVTLALHSQQPKMAGTCRHPKDLFQSLRRPPFEEGGQRHTVAINRFTYKYHECQFQKSNECYKMKEFSTKLIKIFNILGINCLINYCG